MSGPDPLTAFGDKVFRIPIVEFVEFARSLDQLIVTRTDEGWLATTRCPCRFKQIVAESFARYSQIEPPHWKEVGLAECFFGRLMPLFHINLLKVTFEHLGGLASFKDHLHMWRTVSNHDKRQTVRRQGFGKKYWLQRSVHVGYLAAGWPLWKFHAALASYVWSQPNKQLQSSKSSSWGYPTRKTDYIASFVYDLAWTCFIAALYAPLGL